MAGISARLLDSLVGFSGSYCSRIENGEAENVGVRSLARIAAVFGVSIDWLVTGKGDGPVEADVVSSVGRARRKHVSAA